MSSSESPPHALASPLEWTRGDLRITTDKTQINVNDVHRYLSEESYWAANISLALVKRGMEHSLCFAVMHNTRTVGFGRVISDFTAVAYIVDVYILEEFRGQGLGKWLISTMKEHPDLQGLRRWVLVTKDAHGLYEPFGFTAAKNPERYMEIVTPNPYGARNRSDSWS